MGLGERVFPKLIKKGGCMTNLFLLLCFVISIIVIIVSIIMVVIIIMRDPTGQPRASAVCVCVCVYVHCAQSAKSHTLHSQMS